MKDIKIAVTGDSIINRRISVVEDPNFLALVKVLREADVSYTHFESLIHDFDGPEVYPEQRLAGRGCAHRVMWLKN